MSPARYHISRMCIRSLPPCVCPHILTIICRRCAFIRSLRVASQTYYYLRSPTCIISFLANVHSLLPSLRVASHTYYHLSQVCIHSLPACSLTHFLLSAISDMHYLIPRGYAFTRSLLVFSPAHHHHISQVCIRSSLLSLWSTN